MCKEMEMEETDSETANNCGSEHSRAVQDTDTETPGMNQGKEGSPDTRSAQVNTLAVLLLRCLHILVPSRNYGKP